TMLFSGRLTAFLPDLAVELRAILLPRGAAALVADLSVEIFAVLRLNAISPFLPCFRDGHLALRVGLSLSSHFRSPFASGLPAGGPWDQRCRQPESSGNLTGALIGALTAVSIPPAGVASNP